MQRWLALVPTGLTLRTSAPTLKQRPLSTLFNALYSRIEPRSAHSVSKQLFSTTSLRYLDRKMDPGVIAVIGTTGVGKSNLSIQLAKELQGEVINGDALQVYKGLDIITNKMPIEEREGVEHFLMDFLPLESEYSVLDFKTDALKLIDEIHGRKHLPVVVGGTHYYIQSLLWRDTLLDTKKNVGTLDQNHIKEEARANEEFLRDSDTATLYKKLQEVDPVMANKWHENDRRKITRSLQVYFETGQCQSDLIKKQNALSDSERLRMPTCIFWVYSKPDVLNARLDTRVDAMVKGGLFKEIQEMRKNVGTDTDYERGIWQAIGYKEFDPYFTALEAAQANDQPTDTQELENLKTECTELMKTRTRQYAKRQVLWIRNKLLPLCREKDVCIYLLDATSLETWKENVGNVAVKIAKDFFAGKELPRPESLNAFAQEMLVPQRDLNVVEALETWEKKECPICTKMQRIMQPFQHKPNHTKHPSTIPTTTTTSEPADPSSSSSCTSDESCLPTVIIHGPTAWKQHLASRQHRKLKQSMAEMEKEGPNWWFFKAQEYKKRKREGTLIPGVEIVGVIGEEPALVAETRTGGEVDGASLTAAGIENDEVKEDGAGSNKIRKTE